MGESIKKWYKHTLLVVLFVMLIFVASGCNETEALYDVTPGQPVDITVQTVEDYDIEVVINTDLHEDSLLDNIRFPDGATNTGTISWVVANQALEAGLNTYVFQVVYPSGTISTYSVELLVSGHNSSTEDSIVSKIATCEEDGVQYYHCTLCDHDYDVQSIAAYGHEYTSYEHTMGTCVEYGYTYHTCVNCGEYETDENGEKVVVYDTELASHTYDTLRVSSAATCQSSGRVTSTCSVCGETTSTSSSKIDCNYQLALVSSGTCITASTYQMQCTMCGAVDPSDSSIYTGSFGSHVFTTSLTCDFCGKSYWDEYDLSNDEMFEYAKENAMITEKLVDESDDGVDEVYAEWYLLEADGGEKYSLFINEVDGKDFGDFPATSAEDYGWYDYMDKIELVYLSDKIVSIPAYMCDGAENLETIKWGDYTGDTDGADTQAVNDIESEYTKVLLVDSSDEDDNEDDVVVITETDYWTIGKYAFNDCVDLCVDKIPDYVQVIQEYAFGDCINLTDAGAITFEFPADIKEIEANAFSGAVIETLDLTTLDSSYTTIIADAFSDQATLRYTISNSDAVANTWVSQLNYDEVSGTTFYVQSPYSAAERTSYLHDDYTLYGDNTIVYDITPYGEQYLYMDGEFSDFVIVDSITDAHIIDLSAINAERADSDKVTFYIISNEEYNSETGQEILSFTEGQFVVYVPTDVTSAEWDILIGNYSFATTIEEDQTYDDAYLEIFGIGNFAFGENNEITEIQIPSTCQFIGSSAFESASELANVYFAPAEGVEEYVNANGYSTLASGKDKVLVGASNETMSYILSQAFANTAIVDADDDTADFVLPKGLDVIDQTVFWYSNYELESATYPVNLYYNSENLFNNVKSFIAGATATQYYTYNWLDFVTMEIGPGVERLNGYIFASQSVDSSSGVEEGGVLSIDFSGATGLNEIWSNAFSYADYLTEVDITIEDRISENPIMIAVGSYYNSDKTTVLYSENKTDDVFDADKLQEALENSTLSVSTGLFEDCTALASIILTDVVEAGYVYDDVNAASTDEYEIYLYPRTQTVTTTDEETGDQVESSEIYSIFNYLDASLSANLTSLDISGSQAITEIGESALSGFVYIQEVILPTSVVSIKNKAFENCVNLNIIDLTQCENLASVADDIYSNLMGVDCWIYVSSEEIADLFKDENGDMQVDNVIIFQTVEENVPEINIEDPSDLEVGFGDSVDVVGDGDDGDGDDSQSTTSISIYYAYTFKDAATALATYDVVDMRMSANIGSITDLAGNIDLKYLLSFAESTVDYTQLESGTLILPNSITTIGESALANCLNLVGVDLSGLSNFRYIGGPTLTEPGKYYEGAFYNCSSLEWVNLQNAFKHIAVTEYTSYMTFDAYGLYAGQISPYSFYGCINLEYIDIRSDVVGKKNPFYESSFITGFDNIVDILVVDDAFETTDFEGSYSYVTNSYDENIIRVITGSQNVTVTSGDMLAWVLQFVNVYVYDSAEDEIKDYDEEYLDGADILTSEDLKDIDLSELEKDVVDLSDLEFNVIDAEIFNTYSYYDSELGHGIYVGNQYLKYITTDTSATEPGTLILPTSLIGIRTDAFANCEKLVSVDLEGAFTLSEDVYEFEGIYAYAFYGCTSLKNVYLNGAFKSEFEGFSATENTSGDYYYHPINKYAFQTVEADDITAVNRINIYLDDARFYSSQDYDYVNYPSTVNGGYVLYSANSDGISTYNFAEQMKVKSSNGAYVSLVNVIIPDIVITSDVVKDADGDYDFSKTEYTTVASDAFDGINVTSIAFGSGDADVILPAGTTIIEDRAFEDHGELKDADFTGALSLSYIGKNAFVDTGLSKVNLAVCHDNLLNYENAFSGVTIITLDLTLVTKLTATNMTMDKTMADGTVTTYSKLLENGVLDLSGAKMFQSIGAYAFSSDDDKANIKYITTDTDTTDAGAGTLILPTTSNFEIGDCAFTNCDNLESIDLSRANIYAIGKMAFNDCDGLISVVFDNCTSLMTIGNYAFTSCEKLETVSFLNCVALTISDTDESIYMFQNCTSLESVDFTDCTSLTVIPNCMFASTSSTDYIDATITINSVALEKVSASAFTYFKGTVVVADETSKELVESSYDPDPFLGTVEIEEDEGVEIVSVVDLELTSLTASYLNTSYSNENSDYDGWTYSEILEIGALDLSGCTNLTTIGAMYTLDMATFTFYSNEVVHITTDTSGKYEAGTVILPKTITTISENAFAIGSATYDTYLKSVDLSDCRIVSIPNHAFYQCTVLESALFGDCAITSIGMFAFNGCTSLEILDLSSADIASLGTNPFASVPATAKVYVKSTEVTSSLWGDATVYVQDYNGTVEYDGNKYSQVYPTT